VLLTLCEVHRACSASSSALPYALACHKHASNLGHHLLAAEAQLHVADMHLELGLGSFKACHVSALEVMPLILGNGSLRLQGLLYWTLAMLNLRERESPLRLAEEKDRILYYLSKAAQAYLEQEDWLHVSRCFYFIAVLNEALGDLEGQKAAAESWLRYNSLHESTQPES